MKKRVFCCILLYIVISLVFIKAADTQRPIEIAITIDDAPRSDSALFSAEERTAKLIKNLQKAGIPDVLFFVKTSNIDPDSSRRLRAYTAAGYHLGNHSHSHWDADKTDINNYLLDIKKAHDILSGFENSLLFYRYPLLHEGKERNTRDKIKNYLDQLNYKNGYVTVDNYDWYMEVLLQNAVKAGRIVNYVRLSRIYVESLWSSIEFYDNIARQALGRSPRHILLLHENDLAALFIADLAAFIKVKGGRIITPQEAYTDPIAAIVPDVLFNNQGRIAAIARSKGFTGRQLVHESEDVKFLDDLFEKRGVFGK